MIDKTPFFTPPGGNFQDLIGSPIASASTIAPDRLVHHVTGIASISTITVPYEGFSGPIYLIADGYWGWDTSGNIATAGAPILGQAIPFVYVPEKSKWYTLLALTPFTVYDNLVAVAPISIAAIDFINNPGSYVGFELAFDPAGPWSATQLFNTPGVIPVYVRGQKGAVYLIKSTTITIS